MIYYCVIFHNDNYKFLVLAHHYVKNKGFYEFRDLKGNLVCCVDCNLVSKISC